MIKSISYTSPYSSVPLIKTYSDEAFCLKQYPSETQYGSVVIDIVDNPYTYEETNILDLSEEEPNSIHEDMMVYEGYIYTDRTNNYRCIKTGKCEDLTDTEYFELLLQETDEPDLYDGTDLDDTVLDDLFH